MIGRAGASPPSRTTGTKLLVSPSTMGTMGKLKVGSLEVQRSKLFTDGF